jgi:hypothetical protein
MKHFTVAIFILMPFVLTAQEGYIKFNNHTVIHGFLNRKVSDKNGEHIIEFLKSKHDPAPQHYRRADIYEYAINTDTFRVLKNFYPFEVEGFHFEHVDARVLKSGTVDLLGIDVNHEKYVEHVKKGSLNHVMDHTLGNTPYLYVLHEESDQYVRAVPSKKDKFRETLFEVFTEDAVDAYEQTKGEIHFRHLTAFVEHYNKTSK